MNRNRIPILACAFILVFALGMTATAAPKWASVLFAGRQGGSDTDWSQAGSANFAAKGARTQVGVVPGTVSPDGRTASVITVTFPEPFDAAPWSMVTSDQGMTLRYTATSTTLTIQTWSNNAVRWIAVGP